MKVHEKKVPGTEHREPHYCSIMYALQYAAMHFSK